MHEITLFTSLHSLSTHSMDSKSDWGSEELLDAYRWAGRFDSRNLAGKGAEGGGKGQGLGHHGSSQAQHGNSSQGQGLCDDAHDGAQEDSQQAPGL